MERPYQFAVKTQRHKAINMVTKDPYAALRFKEFNIFLLLRFMLVFAWSMQFIVIEWQVYSLTKDPLSLGIIGLMEIVPALSMALFAGHIVDQREMPCGGRLTLFQRREPLADCGLNDLCRPVYQRFQGRHPRFSDAPLAINTLFV